MGIENSRPESAYQGPAATAPDTEDGLYPDADGDLGHKADGDTAALPASNEPRAAGVDAAESEPKQGTDQRPADWNPPPGNPGSDQDAQTERDNGGA